SAPLAGPGYRPGMKAASRARTPLPARRAATAALAALALCGTGAHAVTPEGLWYAEGGAAQVEIASCADGLCGRVVWLRSPFDEDGCTLRDRQNPEPALRARSVLGLQVLRGLRPTAAGSFSGGTIYDPSSGRTYRCEARLEGNDRLLLRGYVGVPWLGRTTRWLRAGSEGRACGEAG